MHPDLLKRNAELLEHNVIRAKLIYNNIQAICWSRDLDRGRESVDHTLTYDPKLQARTRPGSS